MRSCLLPLSFRFVSFRLGLCLVLTSFSYSTFKWNCCQTNVYCIKQIKGDINYSNKLWRSRNKIELYLIQVDDDDDDDGREEWAGNKIDFGFVYVRRHISSIIWREQRQRLCNFVFPSNIKPIKPSSTSSLGSPTQTDTYTNTNTCTLKTLVMFTTQRSIIDGSSQISLYIIFIV